MCCSASTQRYIQCIDSGKLYLNIFFSGTIRYININNKADNVSRLGEDKYCAPIRKIILRFAKTHIQSQCHYFFYVFFKTVWMSLGSCMLGLLNLQIDCVLF